MTKFTLPCSLVAMALLLTGCGSSSSNSAVPLTNPSFPASVTSAASSASGLWRGSLPSSSGDEVSLYLTQSGGQLRGSGVIFRANNPLPIQAGGTLNSNQAILLDLSSIQPAQQPYFGVLSLALQGDTAQGTLYEDGSSGGVALTRTRTLPALNLPTTFQVGFYQVTLDSTGSDEYTGTWTATAGGQAMTCVESFSSGRVGYNPDVPAPWARLSFHDPSGVLELGTAWVQVSSGAIDPDSTILTAQGLIQLK